MQDLFKITRILLVIVLLFVVNKLLLRPYILTNNFPKFLETFVLSFPNFCEAMVGSIVLVNLGLYGNRRLLKAPARLKEDIIYKLAVLIAAIYVLLQEFKVHNLGGRNTYDPDDVVFSVIGLVAAYLLFHYVKPRMQEG